VGQRIKMKWVDDPHSEYQKWVDEQSDLCLYLHMLSVSVSVSTLCRKCVGVGVTPHTSHLQLDPFFFFRVISLQSRCVRVSPCLLATNYLQTTLYLKVP